MKLEAFKKKVYEIFAQRTPEQQEAKMERLYETLTKQLHKPVVMQAEGSNGAEGAAVGQRSVGQSVRAGCVHNFLHYVGPWYTCDDCGAHFHARAEAPSEGALDF